MGGRRWLEMETIRGMRSQQRAGATRNSVPQSLTHGKAGEEQIKCLCALLCEFPCNFMLFR